MHPTLNIAVRAARSAGRILMRFYERTDQLTIETKSRNDFVSEVDRAAEAAIVQELRSKFPDHAILGEEGGSRGGAAPSSSGSSTPSTGRPTTCTASRSSPFRSP